MDNSDGEGQGHKTHKIKRSTSSKSSVKTKKKEIRSQSFDQTSIQTMELLTSGSYRHSQDDDPSDEEETVKHTASIKGMWKKAFKSLKSNDKQTWLSKKGSIVKRKDSECFEDEKEETTKEIDPVYSLLKCAADLPKVPVKVQKDPSGCIHIVNKGDISGTTSPSGTSLCSTSGHGASQHSLELTIPATNRELMHHIVDESLGSEFRTFYKLTSPVKKHWNDGQPKKHSPNSSFDQY